MRLDIVKTTWASHHLDLIAVRTQVFLDEQLVSAADEWDGLDQTATHFLVRDEHHRAMGCARLLLEDNAGSLKFHIGRVAILKPWRGQGIGHKLMRFVLSHCRETAPEMPIYLYAQCAQQHFYEVLGFIAQGEVFMDAGIVHITMNYSDDL